MHEFNSDIILATLKKVLAILEANHIEYRCIGSILAAATRIRASQANPKRKKELVFFKDKGIEPFPDTFVHVAIMGFHFDWMYHVFSTIQNVIGIVRLKLGLSFDPWR